MSELLRTRNLVILGFGAAIIVGLFTGVIPVGDFLAVLSQLLQAAE